MQPTTTLVIDQNGKNIGIMQFEQARKIAQEAGLDLVEVNHNKNTTVHKIMDKGKWDYEQKKKRKSQKHHQHKHVQKEIKIRPTTETHDLDIKVKQIQKFLQKGHSVKITVKMRGREKSQPDLASNKLAEVAQSLNGMSKVEDIKVSESIVFVLVHPVKVKHQLPNH